MIKFIPFWLRISMLVFMGSFLFVDLYLNLFSIKQVAYGILLLVLAMTGNEFILHYEQLEAEKRQNRKRDIFG